jgi:hypothetical protein
VKHLFHRFLVEGARYQPLSGMFSTATSSWWTPFGQEIPPLTSALTAALVFLTLEHPGLVDRASPSVPSMSGSHVKESSLARDLRCPRSHPLSFGSTTESARRVFGRCD